MPNEFEESIAPYSMVIDYTVWKNLKFKTTLENAKLIRSIKDSILNREKAWYMNDMIKTVEKNIALHDSKHQAATLANIKALKNTPIQS